MIANPDTPKPSFFHFSRAGALSALAASSLLGCAMLLCTGAARAQAVPVADKLSGDVGAAVYGAQSAIRSKGSDTSVLPYGFFDYGRVFARVDTVGLKTVSVGYGYLELAARISQDGWRANTVQLAGLNDRKTPVPLGLGTFQQTPYGAFFVNAFVDANASHGALFEASYAAEVKVGRVSFYPQVGLEHRTAKYANYVYGVTPAESAASGYAAYNAGASTTPVLGLGVDVPLGEPWVLSMQIRRKWLDAVVTNSPLVSRKTQDIGFVALVYRFK